VVLPVRDYSQRPQRPIKLKAGISKEPPSPVTHLGPPEVQLAGGPEPAAESVVAAPKRQHGRPLPADALEAIEAAATAAGLTPEQWIRQAVESRPPAAARVDGPVRYDELVLFSLREVNERLAALESRVGARGWLRRLLGW
jgi:hypothetical protein